MTYDEAVLELASRIEALIPANPGILTMTDVFDLFKVEGFYCADLEPSCFQAKFALAIAKGRVRA